MSIRHDDLLDFAKAVSNATSYALVCEQLLKITQVYGLTKVATAALEPLNSKLTALQPYSMSAGHSEAWVQYYLANNCFETDPVVQYARGHSGIAFRWDEAAAHCAHDRRSRRLLHEGAEHGLCAGFVVPFLAPEGEPAIMSFAGERMDLPDSACSFISLLGMFAMQHALELDQPSACGHPALSAREAEVLRWTAAGKTAWDVSVILHIAESTVKEHLARAAAKLGATNKTHAVAEAIRRGIIN